MLNSLLYRGSGHVQYVEIGVVYSCLQFQIMLNRGSGFYIE